MRPQFRIHSIHLADAQSGRRDLYVKPILSLLLRNREGQTGRLESLEPRVDDGLRMRIPVPIDGVVPACPFSARDVAAAI